MDEITKKCIDAFRIIYSFDDMAELYLSAIKRADELQKAIKELQNEGRKN